VVQVRRERPTSPASAPLTSPMSRAPTRSVVW